MTKVVVRKHTSTKGTPYLIPADEYANNALRKHRDGAEMVIEYKRTRNAAHHRKYWALLDAVWESTQAQDVWQTTEEMHVAIKYAIGHTSKVRTKDGWHEYPKDTDFGAMGQDEFDAYYKRAEDFLHSVAENGNQALKTILEEFAA